MDEKVINSLQFNNILSFISSYCVLPSAKDEVFKIRPIIDLKKAEELLKYTQEAYDLIYFYSFSGVEYFDDVTDELEISLRGGALSMGQLLKVASLMRSSRLFSSFVQSVTEGDFSIFKEKASSVYTENYLEKEIFDKIFSEDQMSDNASPLLAELRKKIKNLNIQIKEKLQFYVHTKSDYLQDNIVTMREDRYVIPVKSEYKNKIQGFVHDCSQSGSTYFIEPIEVLEMNNRLKTAIFEEKTEVERILKELSGKVGLIANFLKVNIAILTEIDVNCAKAVYAYKTKAVRPLLNGDGNINIKQGRHPLIDAQKVVPIDVSLGLSYHFLLISGPNTGGKTVTLKMVGLFCLMAMAGIFIQASLSSCVSVFDNVFSDIG
ncbi:MAG TPA: endonuclease MutS2, partial [Clostridiales bacterium]|nr:endonuclease MutS2 [Clostridiales bacterium]